jgi:predicted Zn-dependent protease
MKLWSSAAEDYKAALKSRPGDRDVSLAYAQALIQANDRLEARRVLEDLLRRFPADGAASSLLDALPK